MYQSRDDVRARERHIPVITIILHNACCLGPNIGLCIIIIPLFLNLTFSAQFSRTRNRFGRRKWQITLAEKMRADENKTNQPTRIKNRARDFYRTGHFRAISSKLLLFCYCRAGRAKTMGIRRYYGYDKGINTKHSIRRRILCLYNIRLNTLGDNAQ